MLSKSPTAKATKYVDINGVVANFTIFVPSLVFCSCKTCIFDKAVSSALTSRVTSNLLKYPLSITFSESSKQTLLYRLAHPNIERLF